VAGVVLDASVALAWALPNEPRVDDARAIFRQVARQGASVPALWRVEVGNGLLIAERRGRIRPERTERICRTFLALPIALDVETNTRAWNASMALARKHSLTLYDALYLELAGRLGLPLASFDAALTRAAAAERVLVI
jgi:predicted nucleic acid-binding protein